MAKRAADRPAHPRVRRAQAAARGRDARPRRGRAGGHLLPVGRVAGGHRPDARGRWRLVGRCRRPPNPRHGRAVTFATQARRSPTSTCASSAPARPARPRPSPPPEAARPVLLDRPPAVPGRDEHRGPRHVLRLLHAGFVRAQGRRRHRRRRRREPARARARSWSGPNTYGAGTGVTYLAEHLKVAWERLVDRGRRAAAAPRPGPGRPRSATAGSSRSSSRRGPASRACARRPSSMPPATPTCARSRGFGYETAGETRSRPDPDDDVPDGQRRPGAAAHDPKAEFHALMAEAARRPATTTCRGARAATTSRRSTA